MVYKNVRSACVRTKERRRLPTCIRHASMNSKGTFSENKSVPRVIACISRRSVKDTLISIRLNKTVTMDTFIFNGRHRTSATGARSRDSN